MIMHVQADRAADRGALQDSSIAADYLPFVGIGTTPTGARRKNINFAYVSYVLRIGAILGISPLMSMLLQATHDARGEQTMKLRLFTSTGAMPVFLATVAGATVLAGVVATSLYSPQQNEDVDKGGVSRSAPGPTVGIGLPALVVVGGYVWIRLRAVKRRT